MKRYYATGYSMIRNIFLYHQLARMVFGQKGSMSEKKISYPEQNIASNLSWSYKIL